MQVNKHQGFTLIELVIVIVVLGILAAFAMPKYIELGRNARISAVNGLKGAVRSAATMVRVVAKTSGVSGGIVTIDPVTNATVSVNPSTFYPVANNTTGIAGALETYDGFTVSSSANGTVFTLNGATIPANCSVSYSLDANNAPVIGATITGC